MAKNEIKKPDQPSSPFDVIRRYRPDGSEFWSARELMKRLDYERWENMKTPITAAKASCAALGYDLADHFRDITKVSQPGKRGGVGQDYELSRRACYLVAMCGDASKEGVALAKNYFVEKTREAELNGHASQVTQDQDTLLLLLEASTIQRREHLALTSKVGTIEERVDNLYQLRRAGLQLLAEVPRSDQPAAPLTTRSKISMLVRTFVEAHGMEFVEEHGLELLDEHGPVYGAIWRHLYTAFLYRYHFDARARAKKSGRSKLDEIERAGKLEDFYAMISEILV